MLYSIFTYDCLSCHESTQILKLADATTVLGRITNSDESECRDQMEKRITWCSENNLNLNLNNKNTNKLGILRERHFLPSRLF
ncbi:hypothetical protein NP493_975g03006 [Ridgeia piscesae]|uniref:Uncharacterized protein n=1 Tax=Ridgeia piscesae TaxID=27915 RepID=A0AAD9KKE3_RIDPI|nr:hypothetical protein NP493_975g03006 [Ridgeia piscesae]